MPSLTHNAAVSAAANLMAYVRLTFANNPERGRVLDALRAVQQEAEAASQNEEPMNRDIDAYRKSKGWK